MRLAVILSSVLPPPPPQKKETNKPPFNESISVRGDEAQPEIVEVCQ